MMMTLEELFTDKSLKAKERSAQLQRMLDHGQVKQAALITFAGNAKAAVKATCLEALEYVTKTKPVFLNEAAFDLCLRALADKEPRVKWEAARVIGNTVHRFPERAEEAMEALLPQAGHEGTVVRWSAAYALGQLIGMHLPLNRELVPKAEAIAKGEEKNSIRKIYDAAIMKAARS